VGGFLFGFDSAVINGAVGALQGAFGSTSIGTGFSVASMMLGCAVGAFSASTVADRFGPRPVMLATAVALLVSALGFSWSSTSMEFVIYRLLGSLAVGGASVNTPAYIAEIAPAAYRGRLASLQQMAIVLGIFVALLSNYAFVAISGGGKCFLVLRSRNLAWDVLDRDSGQFTLWIPTVLSPGIATLSYSTLSGCRGCYYPVTNSFRGESQGQGGQHSEEFPGRKETAGTGSYKAMDLCFIAGGMDRNRFGGVAAAFGDKYNILLRSRVMAIGWLCRK